MNRKIAELSVLGRLSRIFNIAKIRPTLYYYVIGAADEGRMRNRNTPPERNIVLAFLLRGKKRFFKAIEILDNSSSASNITRNTLYFFFSKSRAIKSERGSKGRENIKRVVRVYGVLLPRAPYW